MRSHTFGISKSMFIVVIALSCALPALAQATQQSTQTAAASQPVQKSFAAPKEAAEALTQAASNYDVAALMELFGSDGKDIVSTADAGRDKNYAASFAAEAHEKTDVVIDPKNPHRAIFSVGNEEWPLPIPIVKKGGKWYFDTKAGLKQILFRRIGRNEMSTIVVCRQLAAAQKEYYASQHNEYAQKIFSDAGQHNGLYWKAGDSEPQSPIGPLVASAVGCQLG